MAKEEREIFGGSSAATVRDRLSKYIANWPLFLLCVFLCVGTGFFYSRYTVPKYIATTSFLIKGSEGGAPNDLIEESLNGKEEINLNNEILTIRSVGLMERTVAKNQLNVSYFKKGHLLTLNIYNDAPFTLVSKKITDSNQSYTINVKKINSEGGSLSYGPEGAEKALRFRWDTPFSINGQTFMLKPKVRIHNGDGDYIVRWQPVKAAAAELLAGLIVKPYDGKTSVIDLSLKTENLQLGKDILNELFTEFNLSDIEDRKKVSASTIQFIDDRLSTIAGELKEVEGNLENFRGSKQLVDVNVQSSQTLNNSNEASKTVRDISVKQGVAKMILDYFHHPANNNKLVPSSLGLEDATLALLITRYNELQLQKEREAPLVASSNPRMQDLNTQLANLKGSILESLNNITKNLRLQEADFRQRNSQFRSFLSAVPRNERVLQEIKRKQSITEGLYLYLMEKREEAAIAGTASNMAHYKQIDLASGYGPVEPNTRNIILYTSLLGLTIAFGWIYLRDLLNDKITDQEHIVKYISTPVIGQIHHISKRKRQTIYLTEKSVTGEQFRSIRTNLLALLKDTSKKTVLISSCASGEGKTFVSLNLAAACAILGKKVALLEFDLRKPVFGKNLQLSNEKGLSDYLTGKAHKLSDISHVAEEIPSLHVFPSGAVPFNPADLLLTENLSRLFKALKQEYDYIIVDSPPTELFSDALILGEYCDLVFFIIRQRKTLIKQLEVINDMANDQFKNTVLVINDMKSDKKGEYHYYKYGQTVSIREKLINNLFG